MTQQTNRGMKLLQTRSVRQFPLLKPFVANDFRLLWIGQGMSLLGDQFYIVALPLLALSLTGSNLALGSVLMVAATTRALFQLFGGALSDRLSPRSLMLISNIARAVVCGALTVLVMLSVAKLWHLYILAYMSIIPMVVVKEDLQAGNAVLRGTSRFMGFVVPALAGAVITKISMGAAFAIDTFTFVFAALMLLPMKQVTRISAPGEGAKSGEKEAEQKEGMLKSIAEGLRYAWHHRLIRALLILIRGHRGRRAPGICKESLRRGSRKRSGVDAVRIWRGDACRNAAGRFYQADKAARQGAYRIDLHDRDWLYYAWLRLQYSICGIGARLCWNRGRAIEHSTDGLDTRMHRAANAWSSYGLVYARNIGA
jgi:hypothetical protein